MPRSRERRPTTWEGTFWMTVFTGLIFLYPFIFSWDGWMILPAAAAALASTAVLMFAAGFARGMIRDLWPTVPPQLAEKAVSLQASGWSVARAHLREECDEARPHTHMTHQGDGGTLILVWDGTTVLDDHGNILRRES